MTGLSSATLSHLLASYGYWAVFALVALESAGVPLPGEAALITAAIYAGTTHNLDVSLVIAVAAGGAICGDNVGYWVGREVGAPLLRRYGRYIGVDEGRLAIGQLLFRRHAGKIVVFGRFIALLRVLVALLAGINRMEWRRFFLFNACGGILWATVYGLAAYALGETVHRLAGPFQLAAVVLGLVAIGVAWIVVRRRAEAAVVRATLTPQERSENSASRPEQGSPLRND